jgi:arylsulfatase A-like enzyme
LGLGENGLLDFLRCHVQVVGQLADGLGAVGEGVGDRAGERGQLVRQGGVGFGDHVGHLDLFNDKEFPLPDNFYDDFEGREALKRQLLTVKDHMDVRLDFKVPCDTCETHPVNKWAPEAYRNHMTRFTPRERQQWDQNYEKEVREFNRVRNNEAQYDRWKFRRYMEDYLRCIAAVDEGIGQVLDYLEESGLARNTVVVYTSDQGFFLGEHGLFDKRFMYEEALRTPLLVRYPAEIEGGTSCELMVQNLDIAPTLLDLAGIEVPDEMQGRSLRPTWMGDPGEWRDAVYYHYYENRFGVPPHYGIRTERYKLIHFYDELDWWELYDLREDPTEMNNLYHDGTHDLLAEQLKERLRKLQRAFKDDSFPSFAQGAMSR